MSNVSLRLMGPHHQGIARLLQEPLRDIRAKPGEDGRLGRRPRPRWVCRLSGGTPLGADLFWVFVSLFFGGNYS